MERTGRSLWIMTGLASIPFAVLAFINPIKSQTPHIYILLLMAGIYNSLVVPFFLFKDEPNWLQKTLALGINIIFAALWIEYTGGIDSIFFPEFYLLPIIAAAMYCGLVDSLIVATLASVLSLWSQYKQLGSLSCGVHEVSVWVNVIFFFLFASILGYLIKRERKQHADIMKISLELENAYNQLTASHEQLQNYTEKIEKMNLEMEQLALTDELTGLFNYRFFQVALDKEITDCKHSVVTLLMLDIDYFKVFNDKYGHMAGNQMLTEIANVLTESVRKVDTVVRYGGEEFAIIFPGMDSHQASRVCERIRINVENNFINIPTGETVSVTISIGVASYPRDAQTKSELISCADLALYDAKKEGRNRVCIYKESK